MTNLEGNETQQLISLFLKDLVASETVLAKISQKLLTVNLNGRSGFLREASRLDFCSQGITYYFFLGFS